MCNRQLSNEWLNQKSLFIVCSFLVFSFTLCLCDWSSIIWQSTTLYSQTRKHRFKEIHLYTRLKLAIYKMSISEINGKHFQTLFNFLPIITLVVKEAKWISSLFTAFSSREWSATERKGRVRKVKTIGQVWLPFCVHLAALLYEDTDSVRHHP